MSDKPPPDSRSERLAGGTRARFETSPPTSPRPPAARRDASVAPAAATTKARVLVVDDSAICLDATAMMLEDAGYEVSTVDTPFGLSSALTRDVPDLVLVDVGMPGLTGDKLVQITLRNRNDPRPCAIVLHSDRSEHELRELVRASGAAGYIRKTSDAAQLAREVERYLRG
jgi:CheY-like chemotaxis protein